MSHCVTCRNGFHPDFCIIKDESRGTRQCYFCYFGKDYLVIEDNKGNEKKVTKQEASQKYLEFLRRLKDKQNVKDIIDGNY